MTIATPTHPPADSDTSQPEASALFTEEDIAEFAAAAKAWHVPACAVVTDTPTPTPTPTPCVPARARRAQVVLLDSHGTGVRSYVGESGDALKPDSPDPVVDTTVQKDLTGVSGHQLFTLDSSFALASCSKLITAYALHLALTRAGLSWDTPVRAVMPDFALQPVGFGFGFDVGVGSDPGADVSAQCTFEDLLSHRSGVGGWHVVHGPHLAQRDVVEVLAHLPAAKPFRRGYTYASLPFHLAARAVEVLDSEVRDAAPATATAVAAAAVDRANMSASPDDPRASGAGAPRSFVDFVKQEIFTPLGLQAGYRRAELKSVVQGHYQFFGAHGEGEATPVGNGLEAGVSWGSGGVWMSPRDMAKWLRAAPRLECFPQLVRERITEPGAGWLEWRDDGMRSGLGVRAYEHRGVGIVYMAGTTPDFASLSMWLPAHDVGVGVLTNAGVGGVYLRALVRCRAAERVAGLPRKDWFSIISAVRAQDLAPGAWMHPGAVAIPTSEHASLLCGTWTHPSFPALIIAPEDVVPRLPGLGSVPYLPFMYGFSRCLFSPQRVGAGASASASADEVVQGDGAGYGFDACFELEVGGVLRWGMPFEVRVGGGNVEGEGAMVLRGWADEGVEGPVVVFKRRVDSTGP